MIRFVTVGPIAAALAAAVILPLRAQQAAQQPPAPAPVFRSAVTLVPLDVLVTDDKGNVATGLTAKDFQITEKGRPQTIAAFTFVSTPLIERKEFDPVLATPVRDIVTNRIAPHSRAYAVVIDDLHLLEMHAERIRRVLTDLLGSIPTTDRVAVVFTGRSDLSVDLTDDRAAQLQAIGRVRESLGLALDPSPVSCGAKEVQRKQQALGSLEVMRNVASVLAQTKADERSIIYLSEGFNFDFSAAPIGPVQQAMNAGQSQQALSELIERHCGVDGLANPPQSKSPLPSDPQENPIDAGLIRLTLQKVFEAARAADVRIYTLDPRGNLTPDAEVREYLAGKAGVVAAKVTVQNDFLRSVASETEGVAAVQSSDMHGAVRRVLADTSSYYLLGFSPTPSANDGVYHPVEVKVLRPGLHVRARKGYTALDSGAAARTGVSLLSAGLVASDVSRDIALSGYLAPVAPAPVNGLTRAALVVEVLYPGPPAVPARLTDDLQLEVIDAGVEGAGKMISTRAFHFAMTATQPGNVAFLVNDLIDLTPGVTNLRVGLLSKTTGLVGTLALPVRVPDLSSSALQIASLAIGSAGAAEAAMPPDALTGFIAFQPTLRRTFASTETIRVFAPLSWGNADAAADVTVTVTGPGEPITKTLSVRAPGGAAIRRGSVDLSLPLAALTAGDHVLTVRASIGGAQKVEKTVGFRVAAK